jgi:hypothetical protein
LNRLCMHTPCALGPQMRYSVWVDHLSLAGVSWENANAAVAIGTQSTMLDSALQTRTPGDRGSRCATAVLTTRPGSLGHQALCEEGDAWVRCEPWTT